MTLGLALLAPLALVQAASPRSDARFEILRRLRAVDASWSRVATPQQREQSSPYFERAQRAWSEGRLSDCARELDASIGVLPSGALSEEFAMFARTPERRLLDRAEPRFRVRFERLYDTETSSLGVAWHEFVAGFRRGELECGRSAPRGPEGSFTAPDSVVVVDASLAERADETLWLWVWDGDWECSKSSLMVSFVARRDERLAQLSSAVNAAREVAPKLELATLERLLSLLNSLASGSTEAHDYPGARLLSEAEQVVAAAAKGERWYGPERDGEFFLALPIGERAIPTRVFVPPGVTKETSAPLVLALHGRVFDEDTWFDGYGGGQAKELCAQRGWMLAAPRCDGDEDAAKLDAIVASLAERYPIDMKRVFVVGHSRGGGSALKALSQAPTQFRAVATIGAALPTDALASITSSQLFLAAGEHDFARVSVEAMHAALAKAGSKTASLHIYPQAEHWLAVTDALPDVFAWLDQRAN